MTQLPLKTLTFAAFKMIMAKTYDYIIVLKKKSYDLIDNVSKLMLVLGIAAFLFVASSTIQGKNTNLAVDQGWLLGGIAVGVIGWFAFCEVQSKKGKVVFYRFGLMFAAWGWFVLPTGKWISIIYIISCFLEKPMKVSPEVAFDSEEIVFNSFPQKKYSWSDVTNVVLKDGLLSIDLKNNTLLQHPVDEAVPSDVEAEFNAFCKALVESSKA